MIDWGQLEAELMQTSDEDVETNSVTYLHPSGDPFSHLIVYGARDFTKTSGCTGKVVYIRTNPAEADILYRVEFPLLPFYRERFGWDENPLHLIDGSRTIPQPNASRDLTCVSCRKRFTDIDVSDHYDTHHLISSPEGALAVTLGTVLQDQGALILRAVEVEAMYKPLVVSGDSPDKVYKLRPRPRRGWREWREIRGFTY
jgi:hypothetical protein